LADAKYNTTKKKIKNQQNIINYKLLTTTCDETANNNNNINIIFYIMTTPTFHAKSSALEVVKGLNVNLDGKLVLITGGTSGR
jgi:hypothetical protein